MLLSSHQITFFLTIKNVTEKQSVFGVGLGVGYAICCNIGRQKILVSD